MKKILSLVLAVALVLTLSCAALAEGYSGDLKVWVAEIGRASCRERV